MANDPDEMVVEMNRISAENVMLRGLLQMSPKWKCTYGYLTHDKKPLASMGQCPLGFPGCSCGDDLMNAEMEHMKRYEAKVAGQSKLGSVIEVLCNYAIGFVIAFATQYFVLNALGFRATAADSFWITVIFTIVSIIRAYCVRRFFNWLHARKGKL